MKPKLFFDNGRFECNHGAAPRGYGSWAFALAEYADRNDYLDFTFFAHMAKFGEAKKRAAEHFRKLYPNARALLVAVLP